MAQQTPQKQLFDLLVTKNFDPELLDVNGKPAADPSEADIFSFDYIAESQNDYGTVVIMFADDNDVQMYFGDNLGKGMEADDKTAWFDFLGQIKHFATKNMMSFSPKDLNKLKYSMQSMAAMKESIFESWSGTRTTSWNGRPTEARLMIKHKRPLGENDARFRYVESLFIETAEGERYKLPFTKLSGGRAMVEHIRQGGKVWDARGQHITEMVNELNVLSRFRRANHGKIFEGDTAQLVEQTNAYYETAQKTLKSLSHGRGYTAYFESWDPAVITEEEVTVEGLKHLFVTQSLDSRIEDALPLLAKIQQQGTAMKEANIFEAWVNNLAEGTWAIPDTPEKQKQLVELMSKEFPVGPDATNATEQLYDLLGDDELFDQLEELSTKDADADCRQVVYDRMQMLSHDPNIQKVINAIQISDQATMNPAEPTDAGFSGDQEDAQIPANEAVKDPATQTEDPANTQQPKYPEYQDDLASILRIAGVPAEERPAPDYEVEVKEEESLEDVKTIGGDAADKLIRDTETNQRGTDSQEGPVAEDEEELALDEKLIGGQKKLDRNHNGKLDAKDFAMLRKGNAVDEMTNALTSEDEEETDEGLIGALGGGVLGMAATKTPGGAVAGAKLGSALQDRLKEGTALQGQYGHSGKLEPVADNADFLTRLKELSGMIRN